jgi:hypothetical protein
MNPQKISYIYEVAHTVPISAATQAEADTLLLRHLSDLDLLDVAGGLEFRLAVVIDHDGQVVFEERRPFIPFAAPG